MAILLRYESRRKPEVPVFLTNTVATTTSQTFVYDRQRHTCYSSLFSQLEDDDSFPKRLHDGTDSFGQKMHRQNIFCISIHLKNAETGETGEMGETGECK